RLRAPLFPTRRSSDLQDVVGPERDAGIARRAGEGDAFRDEPPAEAEAPRRRLDEEQPQLRHLVGLAHETDGAEPDAVVLGDPEALARRVEIFGDRADQHGGEPREARVPAVFLSVERAVAGDDPSEVARAVASVDESRPDGV